MRQRLGRSIGVLIMAGALALLAAPGRAATPAPGTAAPPFVALTADGGHFELARQRGKVVLLHFWATWCDACRIEMPALAQVLTELQARGLEVLTVSADEPHEQRAAAALAAAQHLPLVMLSAVRPNGFGAPPVLPITYVIDRDGIVRARLLPTRRPLDAAALRAAVDPWLQAPPAAAGAADSTQ
jgi:cytochrome c biogenesis protein CcmG/thiol:disulfide interchange protein DsbE